MVLDLKFLCFEDTKNKTNHENTKFEKHENVFDLFLYFVLSCFRDKRSCSLILSKTQMKGGINLEFVYLNL